MFESHFLSIIQLIDSLPFGSIARVFTFGTSEEFLSGHSPFTESSPTSFTTFYSFTKFILRQLVDFLNVNGIYSTHLILYLVFGPSTSSPRLIPSAIRALKSGSTFEASTGSQLRDFLFIDDLLDILQILLDQQELPPVLNVGSGIPRSVKSVLELLSSLIPSSSINFTGSKRLSESESVYPDITLLENYIRGYEFTDLKSALQSCISSQEI